MRCTHASLAAVAGGAQQITRLRIPVKESGTPFIVGVPKGLLFAGAGPYPGDRAKFVPLHGDPTVDTCEFEEAPVVLVKDGWAAVTLMDEGVHVLCYRWVGNTDWQIFPEMRITAQPGTIMGPEHFVAAVGHEATITLRVAGSAHAAVDFQTSTKFVEHNCDEPPAAGSLEIGHINVHAQVQPPRMSLDVWLKFERAGEYQLCFRFPGGPYNLYPNITMRVQLRASMPPYIDVIGCL